MSLSVGMKRVVGVLIGGTWYYAQKGTFAVDDYELSHPAKEDRFQYGPKPTPEPGFTFIEAEDVRNFALNTVRRRLFGPLSAIQAVSYEEEPGDKDEADHF